MKKYISVCLVLMLVLTACGCGQDQYTVERDYWKVKKQAEGIFRNPAATPPNELDRAVAGLNAFIRKYPKNLLALEADFMIARLYLAKQEYEKSRQQLKGLMEKYGKAPAIATEIMFLSGESYQLQDRWEAALIQYKKVIEDYPLTPKGLELPIYIAQYYKVKFEPEKMRQAYQNAIAHYKGLIEKYPDSPLAFRCYTLVSSCYSALKDWPSTMQTLQTIAAKFKGKAPLDGVLMDMALIYKKEFKDAAKSKELLEQLIKEYPNSRLVAVAKKLLEK